MYGLGTWLRRASVCTICRFRQFIDVPFFCSLYMAILLLQEGRNLDVQGTLTLILELSCQYDDNGAHILSGAVG